MELDYSAASIQQMIHYCAEELVPAPTIQEPKRMLPSSRRVHRIRKLLYTLLDAMERQYH